MIILFLHSILTDMKITFADVAFSMFGICYFVIFTSFIPRIYSLENGKIFIWFLLIISWGSDIVAYLIGRNFGKHKFSKVSPNKTIEGCTAGVVGAVIVFYTMLTEKIQKRQCGGKKFSSVIYCPIHVQKDGFDGL